MKKTNFVQTFSAIIFLCFDFLITECDEDSPVQETRRSKKKLQTLIDSDSDSEYNILKAPIRGTGTTNNIKSSHPKMCVDEARETSKNQSNITIEFGEI